MQSTLYLEGRAVHGQMEKVHFVFLEALDNCDSLVVNIAKVEEFDPSLLFLLCNMHKTARLLNKNMSISGEADDAFCNTLEAEGYSRFKECMYSGSKPTCILGDILFKNTMEDIQNSRDKETSYVESAA